jgi:hypothetical protein
MLKKYGFKVIAFMVGVELVEHLVIPAIVFCCGMPKLAACLTVMPASELIVYPIAGLIMSMVTKGGR